jgi:para-aminobenzoate synthetase component I
MDQLMDFKNWKSKMNEFSSSRTPFFFFISFDKSMGLVYPLDQLPSFIKFQINDLSSDITKLIKGKEDFYFKKSPISYSRYKESFDKVINSINYGDSYLVNLTFPTPIDTNYTLEDIYSISSASYKLLWQDHCVIYSPECFVTIKNGLISSRPMKGTIDQSIPNAIDKLTNDEKEIAEHYTIVDLIRNDLSKVATSVKVKDFRYVEEINTLDLKLLQTSTLIEGVLSDKYKGFYGDLLESLLPAGSISGAPKDKTMAIIKAAEVDDRGFYTGVFGVSDGDFFDSGVAIRYIEKQDDSMIYRSGGGITSMSDPHEEYAELIKKVYVPVG